MRRLSYFGWLLRRRSKKCKVILIATCIVILGSIIMIPRTVMANDNVKKEKVIISVRIEEGDSLWSIAQEYITDDYKSMPQYIREIKKTNHLVSDTIHSGCYLIVPYYRTITE